MVAISITNNSDVELKAFPFVLNVIRAPSDAESYASEDEHLAFETASRRGHYHDHEQQNQYDCVALGLVRQRTRRRRLADQLHERQRAVYYSRYIDITDPEQIEPFIALCFAGKTGRRNFQRLAMRYSNLTQGQIDEAVRKHDNGAFAPAIKGVAVEIAARIRRRSLDLLPIRYYERADESNGKIRLIGVESTLQQCI